MELIELYVIFATATAIIALFTFYIPLVKEARANGVSNVLTESMLLSSLIFFFVTVVLAPFVFPATIIPSQADQFRAGLKRAINRPEE